MNYRQLSSFSSGISQSKATFPSVLFEKSFILKNGQSNWNPGAYSQRVLTLELLFLECEKIWFVTTVCGITNPCKYSADMSRHPDNTG